VQSSGIPSSASGGKQPSFATTITFCGGGGLLEPLGSPAVEAALPQEPQSRAFGESALPQCWQYISYFSLTQDWVQTASH